MYGVIFPTDNMKEFLKLPAKLKVFGKMDRLKEEVKAEVESVKRDGMKGIGRKEHQKVRIIHPMMN